MILLFDRTKKEYGVRNKIAHGTVIHNGNSPGYCLTPFWVPGASTKQSLQAGDIMDAAERFSRLATALKKLYHTKYANPLESREALQKLYGSQPDDLILELRAESDRSRKEQRDRARLLNQARRLLAEGKITLDSLE